MSTYLIIISNKVIIIWNFWNSKKRKQLLSTISTLFIVVVIFNHYHYFVHKFVFHCIHPVQSSLPLLVSYTEPRSCICE